ncbi:glycosyltransferase [Billgrantia azerbaijanica]|nr:glycosyltransferase [Halomonas azerbaijanica]
MISLVVPVFNESARIEQNLLSILASMEGVNISCELIVVDDGSQDDSVQAIERAMQRDERIHLLEFTRNFGKEAAVYAGLEHASGSAVIVMDSDLQHPPDLIPEMIQAWKNGAMVVEGVKRDRGDRGRSRLMAKLFYGMYRRFSGFDIEGHSDFKLLDRQVLDLYLQMPERYRFFRGLVNWLGVESHVLYFDVPEREAVGSRWQFVGLIRYAINNITAFSTIPLALVTFMGSLTVLFGFLLGAITLYQKWVGTAAEGFTTLNILLLILGGAIMISLGIIGHYVGHVYVELKSRPLYVVRPRRKP